MKLVRMPTDLLHLEDADLDDAVTDPRLLAAFRAPESALGAGGSSALRRCERLLQPRDPLGHRGFAIAVTGLALTMLPMLLAALPAAIALILDYCPPGA